MKILYFILLLLFGCSDIQFPWKELTFSEAQIMAKNNNKMIMLDFYADW